MNYVVKNSLKLPVEFSVRTKAKVSFFSENSLIKDMIKNASNFLVDFC